MKDTSLIKSLTVAHALTVRFGTILNLSELVRELAAAACELTQCERCIVLLADVENATLTVAATSQPPLPQLTFSTYNGSDPGIIAWLNHTPFAARQADLDPESLLASVTKTLQIDNFFSLPLHEADTLIVVLIVDNPHNHQPVWEAAQVLLGAVQESAAIALANARLHSEIVAERDAKMRELEMMRQIDRELSDTIRLGRVFDLTLDWAQRFTLAQYASLAVYDQPDDELRFVADLGYEVTLDHLMLLTAHGGIAQRVARSGAAEMIPDVSLDNDYIAISSAVESHMSVPVMREDRVIAVITVESRRINAFTDEHLDFVAKLASRAGVAIDNARLYSEAVREREKLSHILSEIADVVIVVGIDDRIMLINQSAFAALDLYPDQSYIGLPFAEALADTPLLQVFQRIKRSGQIVAEEVKILDQRTYYAEFSPHTDIGWIIVMQNITPLKQTDELKRELVATVSHDLKQPLSIMSGNLQLLQMTQLLDERGDDFTGRIEQSIEHMRRLIDDVLDLAKIESGIGLEIQPVAVDQLINDCIEWIAPIAQSKTMHIETDFAANLPQIAGDPERLRQIFSNLVGNAVKYTPPRGSVRISVEYLDHNLHFIVKDNGMGISPEDQAHIFDRFYRVRRAETEDIEGTGLGLAIVKRLIDAHRGQIGLESSLGEGTTFYVTLPVY